MPEASHPDGHPGPHRQPRPAAHGTAIALRVLDLENQYGSQALIEADLPSGDDGSPDLVCWNCAAIASGNPNDRTVYVWTFKAVGQAGEAGSALETDIARVESDALCGGCEAVAGPKFPTPSAGVNPLAPDQTVEVFSEGSGVELCRTTEHDKCADLHDPSYVKSYKGAAESRTKKKQVQQKRASYDGAVRDDPITG